MSVHRTFRKRKKKFKSVNKKWERLLKLLEEEKEVKSIFGFPKEKIFRMKKIKKKEEEEVTETTEEKTDA